MRKNQQDNTLIDLSQVSLVQRIGSDDEPDDEVWPITDDEEEAAPCAKWSLAAKLSVSGLIILVSLGLIVVTMMTIMMVMGHDEDWLFWLYIILGSLTALCIGGTGFALPTIWRK